MSCRHVSDSTPGKYNDNTVTSLHVTWVSMNIASELSRLSTWAYRLGIQQAKGGANRPTDEIRSFGGFA